MNGYYYSFRDYLEQQFHCRVRRISLNAGFSCPNRDGTLSREGCIFCNEAGFSSWAKTPVSLSDQIALQRDHLRARGRADKYIAYFQNASNTHAGMEQLERAYDVIRQYPDIVGLMIATRPDCLDAGRLDLIARYCPEYDVWIEYGLQTIHEQTLRQLNRNHTAAQFLTAVRMARERGIKVTAHVILGLPEETAALMRQTARALAEVKIDGVKLHALHVLQDTVLARQFSSGKVALLTDREYIGLACDFLERLPADCVIMRLVSDARPEVLVAPTWINDKQRIIRGIEQEFSRRGTRQGSEARHP
jgi:hypothetical protein